MQIGQALKLSINNSIRDTLITHINPDNSFNVIYVDPETRKAVYDKVDSRSVPASPTGTRKQPTIPTGVRKGHK